MDSRTGELYENREFALKALVPDEAIVELHGTEKAIRRISKAVKADHRREVRRKNKAARASRKRNR